MGFGISSSFLNLIADQMINPNGLGRTVISGKDKFYPPEVALNVL